MTRQGLLHNIELMADPAAKDTVTLTYAINSLYDKSWNAKPVILKHLQPLATTPRSISADQDQQPKTYHKHHQGTRKRRKKPVKQQQPTGNFLEETAKDFFKHK